ncbi:hypothetical protein K474DRAFT_152382 [Panus rudis PR-1116 ss-1]|nr:hypothetical protein K474DRAFT_152382 [Panus rudis PR-1116 ss-1]
MSNLNLTSPVQVATPLQVPKRLHKLLATEAKHDDSNIKKAMKELAKVEKAYQRSVKETAHARKEAETATKHRLKVQKIFDSAQKDYKAAEQNLASAEDAFQEKKHHEGLRHEEYENTKSEVIDTLRTKGVNDDERSHRRASLFVNQRQDEPARDTNPPEVACATQHS